MMKQSCMLQLKTKLFSKLPRSFLRTWKQLSTLHNRNAHSQQDVKQNQELNTVFTHFYDFEFNHSTPYSIIQGLVCTVPLKESLF